MKFMKATLCLSIALAINACGESNSSGSHLSSAKGYLDQNKVNESIIELKNSIRLDNKNAEARYLLGKVYLDLGDGLVAVKELERAHTLNFNSDKVIPLLARAYILTDANTDVIALSEKGATLAPEAQSQFLAYQTLAALRSGQVDLAVKSVESAFTVAPNGQYALLASAYLNSSEEKFPQVKALINRILTINAEQVDALMLQGQVSMMTDDFVQAALSFKAYLELQPKAGKVQLLLADALVKSGDLDEAEMYADNILAQVDKQPFAHYIKAVIAFNRKNFLAASEHAEIALQANFNQLQLSLIAGASAFQLKNWQKSHRNLSSVVKFLPADHQARRMLAVAQLELGLVDEIGATLGDIDINSEEDSKFISSLSFQLLQLGATDEAKAMLAQSEGSISNNAGNSARQGMLKLMMNDVSGIENLEDAIQLEPELVEIELALGYASLSNNDITKAKAIANKWIQENPESIHGHSLMANIAIQEEDYQEAETQLNQALKIEANNTFILTEQLRLAMLKQDKQLSQERADALILLEPNNSKVLRLYFGVYQNDMALEKLQQAYDHDLGNVDKALLLAEGMISLNKYQDAERLLVSMAEFSQLPKRYWQTLILTYQRQEKNEQVQLSLENWIKSAPYHIEPTVLLTDFLVKKGDNERALKVVQRGIDNHPDNTLLLLVKMQLLLNTKQVVLAKSLYKTLASKDISEALKEGMQGRIFLLEKQYEQAIPKLTLLLEEYPSGLNAVYLARAYLGSEQNDKAADVLKDYLQVAPNDNRVKTMLAGLYLENDTNSAIKTYEDIVIKSPGNVIAHNNLAWLYMQNGDLENALQHANKAFQLAPQVPNVIDTYGKVLLKSGDKRAGLKHATKAYELTQGKDVDIKLNYIEALIANSRPNEAKQLLSNIVTTNSEQSKLKTKLELQL